MPGSQPVYENSVEIPWTPSGWWLLKLAESHPPPQEWFDEDDDPFKVKEP